MGASVYLVCDMDMRVLGYTRYQNTADVMETHAIHRDSREAADRSKGTHTLAPRHEDDVLVWVVSFWNGDSKLGDKVKMTGGWRAWANKELTLFSDIGHWSSGDGYSYDYGYTDVIEPDAYAAKHYVPIPKIPPVSGNQSPADPSRDST